jgi:hypothetical protein
MLCDALSLAILPFKVTRFLSNKFIKLKGITICSIKKK